MSENLLIAIIGLAGAVLAALIGAFGAIAAAEIKGKGKAQDKSTSGCGMIGLAASFAGAIGLVLGLLFATSLVQQLESATPQLTAVVQVQPTPVAIVVTATAPQPVPQPTFTIVPTTAPVPTSRSTQAAPYHPSCNWANDWELQPDGSYLWIGFPPGSPNCQNIGQAGELLQRLRNGENLTLVVEVGDTPMGLDICRGDYTATTVTQGQRCVPSNPELWPKVTGKLIVTGSDGFLVGTGK